jgi:hypothetical protein
MSCLDVLKKRSCCRVADLYHPALHEHAVHIMPPGSNSKLAGKTKVDRANGSTAQETVAAPALVAEEKTQPETVAAQAVVAEEQLTVKRSSSIEATGLQDDSLSLNTTPKKFRVMELFRTTSKQPDSAKGSPKAFWGRLPADTIGVSPQSTKWMVVHPDPYATIYVGPLSRVQFTAMSDDDGLAKEIGDRPQSVTASMMWYVSWLFGFRQVANAKS